LTLHMNKALEQALPVLERLQLQGYEAVFVGGCVRDTWLGRQLHDVDIATSATPEQVMEVFPRSIPTGLQHGTVTVVLDREHYEVTTFRTESEYEMHRRPTEVQFVSSLEEDLQRRDFTINAMALRADGSLVDPFGGAKDLQQHLLRCVGDAEARFQEDALRMVRAIRFAAELQLQIDTATWRAMILHRSLLSYVAMERVAAEVDKMMAGRDPARALSLLAESGLLTHTKQPLPKRWIEITYDEMDLSSSVLSQLTDILDLDNRWAAFTLVFGFTLDDAHKLAHALCFSSKRKALLMAKHRIGQNLSASAWRHMQLGCPLSELRACWIETVIAKGRDAAASWLSLVQWQPSLLVGSFIEVVESSEVEKASQITEQLSTWLTEMPVSSIKELAVDGMMVTRHLQRPGGPWLGKLLARLLHLAAAQEVANDADSLLALAEQFAAEEI